MSARLWDAAQGDDEWEIPDEWLNERSKAEWGSGASGSERLGGEIGQAKVVIPTDIWSPQAKSSLREFPFSCRSAAFRVFEGVHIWPADKE
jgi:hypothetical protein